MSPRTVQRTPEIVDPELVTHDATEAERLAAWRKEAVKVTNGIFADMVGEHTRVRVTFSNRKIAVPGRVRLDADGRPALHTNWGLVLDLSAEPVVAIEKKDLNSGQFIPVK